MRKAAKRTATPATPAPTTAFVEDEFEDRKATAEEVRAHAEALRRHAAAVGVTDIRVDSSGTVLVRSDQPGLRQVFDLSDLISRDVGCYVHVIPDDGPVDYGSEPL
jgi:hypothetical protein